VSVPRKMKETETVENNEKKKNVVTGFIKILERLIHLRKHGRGWKDSNKMDLSA
jgi:hypothetical protein